MILGIGSDLVLIERIDKILKKHPQRFLSRVFHKDEQTYALNHKYPATAFASRFAAKEAALKALGTGLLPYFNWHDIWVQHNDLGMPCLMTQGTIHAYLDQHFASKNSQLCWHLTLTHDGEYAQAFAVLESRTYDNS